MYSNHPDAVARRRQERFLRAAEYKEYKKQLREYERWRKQRELELKKREKRDAKRQAEFKAWKKPGVIFDSDIAELAAWVTSTSTHYDSRIELLNDAVREKHLTVFRRFENDRLRLVESYVGIGEDNRVYRWTVGSLKKSDYMGSYCERDRAGIYGGRLVSWRFFFNAVQVNTTCFCPTCSHWWLQSETPEPHLTDFAQANQLANHLRKTVKPWVIRRHDACRLHGVKGKGMNCEQASSVVGPWGLAVNDEDAINLKRWLHGYDQVLGVREQAAIVLKCVQRRQRRRGTRLSASDQTFLSMMSTVTQLMDWIKKKETTPNEKHDHR